MDKVTDESILAIAPTNSRKITSVILLGLKDSTAFRVPPIDVEHTLANTRLNPEHEKVLLGDKLPIEMMTDEVDDSLLHTNGHDVLRTPIYEPAHVDVNLLSFTVRQYTD